jgi:hypothetical protein
METIVDAYYEKILSDKGVPVRLLSDRGTEFMNKLLGGLADMLKVKRLFTTAYHPQTNGKCERMNKTVKEKLIASLGKGAYKEWDTFLRNVQMAVNSSISAATGFSPFELEYGVRMRLPMDLMFPGKVTEKRSQLRGESKADYLERLKVELAWARDIADAIQKDQAEKLRAMGEKPHLFKKYKVGEQILVYEPAATIPGRGGRKLAEKWSGPHTIVGMQEPLNIIYEDKDTLRRVTIHIGRAQLVKERQEKANQQQVLSSGREPPSDGGDEAHKMHDVSDQDDDSGESRDPQSRGGRGRYSRPHT